MIRQIITIKDCRACPECCCIFEKSEEDYIPLLFEETKKEWVRQNLIDEKLLKKVITGGWRMPLIKRDKDYVCPFLDRNNLCMIHQKNRPFKCFLYPFFLTRDRTNQKVILSAVVKQGEDACPVILKLIGSKKFNQYIAYLKKYLSSQKIYQLVKKYPALIEPYWDALHSFGEIEKLSFILR